MDIKNSIVAILNTDNEIVGTGFVAADCLIVTCAHVIDLTKAAPGGLVRIRFAVDNSERFADIDASAYSPQNELDVAILRVSQMPKGVQPLRMSASAGCSGHAFFATGYPKLGDFESLSARGEIISLEKDKRGNAYLQLRSQEVAPGMSGGPVLDTARNAVVGMVNSGFLLRSDKKHRDTAFATPSETIWQVCPQLKPIISPLPRRNPIVEGINLLPYDYDQRIQNFLIEYLGTESHPVPFGGRDEALQMLDNWLTESTPYLLLAAPAGRGKSALLVRWLDSLKEREDLALAFVPVSIRFGTNMERVFYAALAARLAFLHGDDIPASPETSTTVYRGLVSDYLSKPLANGRTLLVVLDGLDEAADWQAGADFMPGELPAGVRVVVSARFLAGDADSNSWLRRLNWERNGLAAAPSLTPLDLAGVADVLLKMGCPLDELSRNVDIVAELYRLSEGDPLLVGLYVGDMLAKGEEVTRLRPEDLANFEPGYKGYFDRWWEDQKKLWGKEKPWLEEHIWIVLNLLAGALGPLFKDDMQALAPELKSNYIADALEGLRRFIIGDNQIQGYTFSHPKLGQYFWEALTPAEQALEEERFRVWRERIFQEFIDDKRNPKKKAEVPVYVVRNYGAHLARANEHIKKWLPLIHHQQWAQAWFTVEGAYGGYLQDVQRVWEQCRLQDRQSTENTGKATYPGQQIRCGLIEASLHSLAENIPPELIGLLLRDGIWTWPQTWVFVKQVSDPAKMTNLILELLPELNYEQLLDVLKIAQLISDDEQCARVLSGLTDFLGKEDLVNILEAARTLKNRSARAEALIKLAQKLPEIREETLEIAREIPGARDRARVLGKLTQVIPTVKEEALETLEKVSGAYSRSSVLYDMAKWFQEMDLDDVLTATLTLDQDHRALVLKVLAKRLPSNSLKQVLAAAVELQSERELNWVLIPLVRRLSNSIVLNKILPIARVMEYEVERARLLSVLAEKFPKLRSEALEAVRKISPEYEELPCILCDLAQQSAEIIEEALESSQEIEDEKVRSRALVYLAQKLPEKCLPQVLKLARSIKNASNRAKALTALAKRMPEISKEALESSLVIKEVEKFAKILSTLAQQVSVDLFQSALDVITELEDDDKRAEMLIEIASRMPSTELDKVLRFTQAIDSESNLSELLSVLSYRLPDESLGQVLEITRTLEGYDRAKVMSKIARRSPELGEEALKAARMIESHWKRACVLSELTKILPDVNNETIEAINAVSDERELTDLARYLQDEHLDLVLELTLKIKWYEQAKAFALDELAKRLPEEDLIRVLESVGTIKNDEYKCTVLRTLAQRIPYSEIRKVLEAVRTVKIGNIEWYRAYALCNIVQRLPEVSDEALEALNLIDDSYLLEGVFSKLIAWLPERYLEQALVKARAIKDNDEGERSSVLCALAKRLPYLTAEALLAIQSIENSNPRAGVLSDLCQPLMSIPNKETYICLETSIPVLSARSRADLFSDLAALMPVIIHLGTNDTPREIYEAVRDVTIWWP